MIILSEVSQRKTYIIWYHLYVESKKIQMRLYTKQKQIHRHRKQTYGSQRRQVGGRVKLGVWELYVYTHLLLLLFSCSAVCHSLWLHEVQHARIPCPSPSPWGCSNSCPLNLWSHQTISSSVTPFFSCPQSFSASGSFLMSQLKTTGGQSIGASAPSLPMNIQYSGFISFRIDCFDLLAVQGTLKSLLYSVQFSSVAQSCPTLCDPMNCSTPGLSVHHQLPEPTQTHVHWISDAIQPSHLLSSRSPTFNFSQHQCLFQWVCSSHHVAKVLEFQFQHQSFQYSGLISFRIDWLDLLAVQGTLKSLPQHHSSKASVLLHSDFF